jgi:RNA polymerase sigma-70 factor (ECF subfamily)
MIPAPSSPDAEWIRRAQAGDSTAFDEIVRKYEGPLYGYFLRRIGHSEDARDACQQVFVAAYRGLARFDARRPFEPWFYTLARRHVVDHYRRRRPPVPSDEVVGNDDPASELDRKETADALWVWVRRHLSGVAFMVFWLRVERNLSLCEIALAVGKSELHVKVILFRARRALAVALARDAPDEVNMTAGRIAAARRMEA